MSVPRLLAVALAVGVVSVLLVVVAATSVSTHVAVEDQRWLDLSVPTPVALAAAAVTAAFVLAAVLSGFSGGNRAERPRQSRVLATIVVLLILLGLSLLSDPPDETVTEGPDTSGRSDPTDTPESLTESSPGSRRSGPSALPWASALAAVCGVALVAYAIRSRAAQRATAIEDEVREDGPPVEPHPVLPTFDALRSLPPREAVIAAEATLEANLAAAGLPRRPSEAPAEYARRARGQLGPAGRSVVELTRLGDRARFSHHHIDERMREAALAALGAVLDELGRRVQA